MAAFIITVYSNTLNVPWHFDDTRNILENSRIHMDNLLFETVKATFFASINDGEHLYRPFACFSFGLNWLMGGDSVIGYHIVNIGVHLLTAFFLYLTLIALFETPGMAGRNFDYRHFTALLSAILWALHPIQTQAVTYIVQRMASMAAMFYIIGIYAYLKARLNPSRIIRNLLFLSCGLAFVLAVGSKENAITFPFALILVEFTFFNDLTGKFNKKTIVITIAAILGAVLLIGLFILYSGSKNPYECLSELYSVRSFTMTERFLTQFRVLFFYISQIIYPISSRLCLMHDMEISVSLFHPWTTLPAIIFIFSLTGICIRFLRRFPMPCFSILFFFLAHLVESSILPLEPVFEHRNYLPSLFLFTPLAMAIKYGINHYQNEHRLMPVLLSCFTVGLMISLGIGTYARNAVWKSERTLWEDVAAKYPKLSRPYSYLGAYYLNRKEYKEAFRYYQIQLSPDLHRQNYKYAVAVPYFSLAYIYAIQGEYDQAIKLQRKAVNLMPLNYELRSKEALYLVKNNQYADAIDILNIVLGKITVTPIMLNLKGTSLLRLDQPEDAIPFFRKSLHYSPTDPIANMYIGIAFAKTGKFDVAERFFQRLYNENGDIPPLLRLIENSLNAGNEEKALKYADITIMRFPRIAVKAELDKPMDGQEMAYDKGRITPVLTKAFRKRADWIRAIEEKAEDD